MFCRNVLDGIYYIFVAFVTTFVGKRLRIYTLPFIVKVLTFAP